MDRREDLERWIEGSKATQQKLKLGLVCAGIVSLGLMFVSRAAGTIGVLVTAFVALSGFWITGGHIAEWSDRLDKLDRPATPAAAKGGKRRYQSD